MDVMAGVVQPFLETVEPVLPGASVILYGSHARGEAIPGSSDVNLMLVVDRLDPDTLRRLEPGFQHWAKRGMAPPLVLTRDEWRRASDVFPVEITDMKAGYRVLRGEDPLKELKVRPADLRPALERELRGKLTRLRQAFIPSESRPDELALVARGSIASLAALWRGLLVLAGRPAPAALRETLVQAGQLLGLETAALEEIAGNRGNQKWRCGRETFEHYLSAVEASIRFVDTFQIGDQA